MLLIAFSKAFGLCLLRGTNCIFKCTSGDFCCLGRAMAQAVIRHSHTAEARVNLWKVNRRTVKALPPQPVRLPSCQYRCCGRSSLDVESAASQLANIMSVCCIWQDSMQELPLTVLTVTHDPLLSSAWRRKQVQWFPDTRPPRWSVMLCLGCTDSLTSRSACWSCMFGKYRTEALARWLLTWRSCLAFPQILQANAVIVLHIGLLQLPCFRIIIH